MVTFEKWAMKILRGSVAPQEAKYQVFKYCPGFNNFTNNDRVWCGDRGIPVVVSRLKTAII
jgi:hypothetical protein